MEIIPLNGAFIEAEGMSRYTCRRSIVQGPRPEREGNSISIFEVILIGVALSADAMSVTVCNLLANPKMRYGYALAMPIAFGLFQGLMPALGYFAGSFAASLIETYAGIVAFVILGIIGGKMIYDGIKDDGELDQEEGFSWSMLLFQAVATSIDAFAVGVSLVAQQAPIVQDACIIALCTFLLCCVMLVIGRKAGLLLGQKSQIIGGIILVFIGLKALFF